MMMINPAALDMSAPRSASARSLMDQGFVILRGAAPAEIVARVAADLAPRFDATPFCEGGFYGERTKRFGRLLIRSPHMVDLVMNPAILDIAEVALGNWCDRIQLNLAQAIELHPGALAQLPHRDQDLWQGSLGEVEYLVNVMWPLTSFMGGTRASISTLVGASQSATGALQAAQAGNQILAVQSQQLSDLAAAIAAQGRAQMIEAALADAAEAEGRERFRRFRQGH